MAILLKKKINNISENKLLKTIYTWKPGTTEGNHIFNTYLRNTKLQEAISDSQKAVHFCLALLSHLALLVLEEIFPDQQWPGWALPVTSSRILAHLAVFALHVWCGAILRTATIWRCLCALVQLCPLKCWQTQVYMVPSQSSSAAAEAASCCVNRFVVLEGEAGQGKISSR